MKGQLPAFGWRSSGREMAAKRVADVVTSTVVRSLSPAPFTMAFQLACSKAANRTIANTPGGMASLGQVHLAQEHFVARVAAQVVERRVGLDIGESPIALPIGVFQPFERLVVFSAPGKDLCDLESCFSRVLRDQLFERVLRLSHMAERML